MIIVLLEKIFEWNGFFLTCLYKSTASLQLFCSSTTTRRAMLLHTQKADHQQSSPRCSNLLTWVSRNSWTHHQYLYQAKPEPTELHLCQLQLLFFILHKSCRMEFFRWRYSSTFSFFPPTFSGDWYYFSQEFGDLDAISASVETNTVNRPSQSWMNTHWLTQKYQ